jgi:hypothetical protein
MPVLKQKPRADTLYVCFESFATSDPELAGCGKGTRLRGDHPVVKRWPQFFVRADSADDEIAEARRAFYADAGSPPPAA